MKTLQIDDKTKHRLRIFIASENSSNIHGKIGVTVAKAINRYIDQEEKHIDDLAKKALSDLTGDKKMKHEVRLADDTVCTPDESVEWRNVRKKPIIVQALRMLMGFEVDTLEGTHQGNAGDYLLKSVEGELYPVKKEIFEKTYDIIKEEDEQHNKKQNVRNP